jgi:hypothetical protein
MAIVLETKACCSFQGEGKGGGGVVLAAKLSVEDGESLFTQLLRPFFRRMMRHSDTPITYQHGATMKQN